MKLITQTYRINPYYLLSNQLAEIWFLVKFAYLIISDIGKDVKNLTGGNKPCRDFFFNLENNARHVLVNAEVGAQHARLAASVTSKPTADKIKRGSVPTPKCSTAPIAARMGKKTPK